MRVVCLLSGGIDSPVAAYLMAKQGAEVVLLHMDNSPYSEETELGKVMALWSRLEEALGRPLRMFKAPHGRNQAIFARDCDLPYQCVLCKRMMLHVAKSLAIQLEGEAIVTGESLGQVASQTLHNLRVESSGLDFLVLRPLIGLDKIEIEGLAKKIGTYEVSIRHPSVCTIVPNHPITMCRQDDLLAQERKVDFGEMIGYASERVEEAQRSS